MATATAIKKSTRHSKLSGDFGEALTLYWLSRDAFECARIDHTGIDLLARNPHTGELMGVSVKCRSRSEGTEGNSVSIDTADFRKVAEACKAFGCVPYFALVVDGRDSVNLFLTSMAHLESVAQPGVGKMHWGMKSTHLAKYRADPEVRSVELSITMNNWWTRVP